MIENFSMLLRQKTNVKLYNAKQLSHLWHYCNLPEKIKQSSFRPDLAIPYQQCHKKKALSMTVHL
jgi:hypothetical protein